MFLRGTVTLSISFPRLRIYEFIMCNGLRHQANPLDQSHILKILWELIKNGHCNIMQRRLSFLSWNGEITLNFPSFIKCFTEIIKGEPLFPKKIILWNFYFSKNPYLLLFQGITLFITYAHTHTHTPPAWIRYSIDMFWKEGRLS